jgi:hypothetical protein
LNSTRPHQLLMMTFELLTLYTDVEFSRICLKLPEASLASPREILPALSWRKTYNHLCRDHHVTLMYIEKQSFPNFDGVFTKKNAATSSNQITTQLAQGPPPPLPSYHSFIMGISIKELENSIRTAFQIIHLEILDQSSGCGESYSVFIVSSVRYFAHVLAVSMCIRSWLTWRDFS